MRRPRVFTRETPPPAELPTGWLGYGVLAGPTTFTVVFLVGLMLVRPRCTEWAQVMRITLPVMALLLTVLAGWAAWWCWRAVRDRVPPASGGLPGRNRFLAQTALAMNVMSLLLLGTLMAVIVVLDPCRVP